ncbi:hypothetical protein H8959_012239 [Pygathrix nigripes]
MAEAKIIIWSDVDLNVSRGTLGRRGCRAVRSSAGKEGGAVFEVLGGSSSSGLLGHW